jgi:hypothetical protein
MIQLWDGYVISADAFQYVLGKPEKDEERMREATYHSTISQALLAFHKIQLRKRVRHELLTLADVIVVSAEIEKRIRDLNIGAI